MARKLQITWNQKSAAALHLDIKSDEKPTKRIWEQKGITSDKVVECQEGTDQDCASTHTTASSLSKSRKQNSAKTPLYESSISLWSSSAFAFNTSGEGRKTILFVFYDALASKTHLFLNFNACSKITLKTFKCNKISILNLHS